MSWYEIIAIIVGMTFGGYLVLWSIPAVIMSAMVSLGNIERIVFIDKQLAKNLNKYYDEKGYMRWDYQMSYAIGTRLFGYWLAYPFIKHRMTTTSKKFRLFMWVNCIGVWSFFIAPCFALLVQWLGTID